jgi:hypothetical protein
MSQMLAFNLTMPEDMLDELALNVHGVESVRGLSQNGVLSMVEDVLSEGLQAILGESDDFTVHPAGPGSFAIQIPLTALSDVALNDDYSDNLEGLSGDDLCEVMGKIVMAGLEELSPNYTEGWNLRTV